MKTKTLIFWCCLFAFAAMLTVRPAHAATSFTLTPGIPQPFNHHVGAYGAATGAQACQSYVGSLGGSYSFVSGTDASEYPATNGVCTYRMTASPFTQYTAAVTPQFLGCPVDYSVGSYQGTAQYCVVNASGNTTPNGTCSGTVCTCNTNFSVGANGQSCTATVCTAPQVLNGNGSACITPAYQGSGALTVCTSDGLCSPSSYSTVQEACNSFVMGMAPSSATVLPGNVCKVDQYYSDGSHRISYQTIGIANICAPGDTACQTAAATAATATAAGVYASNVSATATQAASNATSAAIAAGASAASAAVIAQTAAAQTAADMARGSGSVSGSAPAPADYAKTGEANAAANKITAKLDADLAPGNMTVGASSPSQSQIYTKSSRTVSNAFSDFTTSLRATPIIAAAGSFFDVSLAGSCQTWSFTLSVLNQNFGTHTFDHFCTAPFTDYLPMIRGLVLAIFTIAAFRIAML